MFKVGVIGCGRISDQYLPCLTEMFGGVVELAACSDLNLDAAREKSEKYGAGRDCSPEELLADGSIDVAGLGSLADPRDAQQLYQDIMHRRVRTLATLLDWRTEESK